MTHPIPKKNTFRRRQSIEINVRCYAWQLRALEICTQEEGTFWSEEKTAGLASDAKYNKNASISENLASVPVRFFVPIGWVQCAGKPTYASKRRKRNPKHSNASTASKSSTLPAFTECPF